MPGIDCQGQMMKTSCVIQLFITITNVLRQSNLLEKRRSCGLMNLNQQALLV